MQVSIPKFSWRVSADNSSSPVFLTRILTARASSSTAYVSPACKLPSLPSKEKAPGDSDSNFITGRVSPPLFLTNFRLGPPRSPRNNSTLPPFSVSSRNNPLCLSNEAPTRPSFNTTQGGGWTFPSVQLIREKYPFMAYVRTPTKAICGNLTADTESQPTGSPP